MFAIVLWKEIFSKEKIGKNVNQFGTADLLYTEKRL